MATTGTEIAGAPVADDLAAQAAVRPLLLLGDWLATVSAEAIRAGRRPVNPGPEDRVVARTPVELEPAG